MSSLNQPESIVQPIESAAQNSGHAIDQYQLAGPIRRLSAAILDWICVQLTGFVVGLTLALLGIAPDPNLINLVGVGVTFAYFWYFWTQQDGQTPGKHAYHAYSGVIRSNRNQTGPRARFCFAYSKGLLFLFFLPTGMGLYCDQTQSGKWA
jgi:uncharacterized RDD family membrane protein YckC